MRKNFPRCVAIIFLALCAPAGRADVVVLKGGEKIEGRITSETPAEVRIEVKVSASIVDERVIPRADVASSGKHGTTRYNDRRKVHRGSRHQ